MIEGPSRRILFVGLNYRPEPIGIGPYTAGLAEALARRGHQVRAVVGQPYYPDWKANEEIRGRWRTTDEHGVTVTRCPHYIPANPTGARRLVHYASFAASAYWPARTALREFRPELVFTVAPSMVAVPVALHLARVVGIPLWLHVQDFEVGAAFATGLLSEEGAIAQTARNFEERMLRSANVVSSISQPMCRLAVAKGVAPERIVELRNWANHAEQIPGANGERLRAEWGLAGKTVALYSGNIANKQGLEIVIEAARHLAGRPDIAFVVSGEGPNRRSLEQLASGMDNIQFRDLQPIERVGELFNLADIHLLPQLPGAADLVLPSKLGNMLASGRPIVATALPGSGIAHEIDGGGMIVSPLDAAALAKAVGQLADDPDLRTRMGQAGCARAAEHWESEAVVDRFEKRMQQVLGVTDW